MPKVVVNLDSPDFLGLSALDRHMKITVRLRDAGFKFSAIEDLWPVELQLEQPYSLSVDGPCVTFEQSEAH